MEEIYKERYETFRHLDKLRWQMLQLSVAAGSAVLAFGDVVTGSSADWKWAVTGFIFLVLGIAMIRIGNGIKANAEVLCEVGSQIGDKWIPKPTPNHRSVSFWISVLISFCGVGCIAASLIMYLC